MSVVAVLQEIIGADEGGVGFDQFGRDGLAIEPLLQVAEGSDGDRTLFLAPDQQLAIDRALEGRGTSRMSGKAPEISSPVRE